MIPLLSLTFHFSTPADAADPRFPGAAWRGAFGYALKRTVCVMRPGVCGGCPFELSCAYPYVFETSPGDDAKVMAGAGKTPRPFVLRLPAAVRRGETRSTFELGITLMGRAVDHLPYIIHAMAEAGRRGIGPDRVPNQLDRVGDAADGATIWSPGSNLSPRAAAAPPRRLQDQTRVAVTFASPLRLVRNGAPIRPEQLDGPTLAFAAIRRVALLRDGFARELPAVDFNDLRAKCDTVRLEERTLDWSDRRRFSTRQKRTITMGGMMGTLVLDIAGAPEVLPFLETCEHVHIGKGATLGLGEVSLRAA